MRATVRESFKANPLSSSILAVLLVGLVLVAAQLYLGRHENWRRDYDSCKTAVANRRISAQSSRKDAEREFALSGSTKNKLISQLHKESADEATVLALALEAVSAPTLERQMAYCKRINPEPGIFG